MFCQKCGNPIPNGAGNVIGERLLCDACADSLVGQFCQRCGCELPSDTQPQENGKLLCRKCAEIPDDSDNDKPFRDGDTFGQAAERFRLVPVWIAFILLLLAGAAIAGMFATKMLCFHKWQPATCQEPEICLKCGHIRGEPLPHKWKEADCLEPRTCMLCGETEGEPLGHDWLDATCTEPQICARCGAETGEPTGHIWEDANCEHPRRCTVCGLEEGEPGDHVWLEATCEEPMTCEICGKTKGEALGHEWLDATCTEPETCKICGKTKGSPKGHDWKPATIAAPKTCERCGETEGEPLRISDLYPIDLMEVTKRDFVKATDDAHHEAIGCTECSGRNSTLASDSFPGCVLAFESGGDSTPEHIHVFEGNVTEDISVGMSYEELEEALGEPTWKLNEGDLSVTALYTISGHSVGFEFSDMRIFRDIVASQIGRRSDVTIRHPETRCTSVRID